MWQSSDRVNRTPFFHFVAPAPMERAITDRHEDGLYKAGERVLPGVYRRIDAPGRKIVLEREDVLPASLDGHVAEYERIDNTWDQICHERPVGKA
jgi:hypothetical protein